MVIADHNGYPTIPEFNGDYTTGLSYYENAPSVTVSPSGSSTSSGNGTYSAAPAASSSANYEASSAVTPIGYAAQGASSADVEEAVVSSAPAAVSSAPAAVSSAPAVVEPATAVDDSGAGSDDDDDSESGSDGSSSSSECTHGTMACTADGSGYQTCVWGTWSVVINCPTETLCKPFNGSILCDWA
ncbi:hypothetical protein LPJ59_007044 [Coemansia sp. RSA 2399]|nr:hypothetical protein LPJ59_007044 [Coemansia sp. RSA 2399]KAJ1884703.1 hypothetical protein LPJ81_007039 [Coemansia sp. IMI 209127]